VGLFLTGTAAYAQEAAAPPAAAAASAADAAPAELPFAIDGPSPPQPPAVIVRNEAGKATLRATALTEPIRIDGALDEAIYTRVPAMADFIQIEPDTGSPATQKTEVWLFFDRDQVYVSARAWETNMDRLVITEMRRDMLQTTAQNDRLTWVFDTFYDRRNGVMFSVTPLGARLDVQLTDRQTNVDWNPVWDFAVRRFENGWSVEAAIPFKSLRYRPGRTQIWGFNIQRLNRWKNELTGLVPVPRSLGPGGVFQTSLAATLVGLEAPSGSRNIEIKPYAISELAGQRTETRSLDNDLNGDVGLDVKYGITQNLTADFTINTDFAQVEADEQQINLTRFNLLFPEKREFFLENQGTFSFGGAATTGVSDTPILFYSRRIGLDRGQSVPILGGGRVTGRVGRFTVGALSVQTDDEPVSASRETNFTVLRLKRDIWRRSAVGVIATRRSISQFGPDENLAYGFDGTFRFFEDLSINSYWARTRTPGVSGDDTSYRAQLDYAGDRYGLQLEQLVVGDEFIPETGFVRRDDMRRSFGQGRFSPRPRSNRVIRRYSWIGSMTYIENGDRVVETRDWDGEFAIEFQNSDRFSVGYGGTYEFLPVPFRIASGVTLPVGEYDYESARVGFNLGQQHLISGNALLEYGTFYDGHKTSFTFTRGRVSVRPKLALEPSYSLNVVDLPEGDFTTHLVGSRVVYTMTARMFASALLQYNSDTNAVTSNVRVRWEYQPGSELFVVYNEERDTLRPGFPSLTNRAFIVKVNRLFRF
jgi:hypothetical protein